MMLAPTGKTASPGFPRSGSVSVSVSASASTSGSTAGAGAGGGCAGIPVALAILYG
jgi:hypothetical protein